MARGLGPSDGKPGDAAERLGRLTPGHARGRHGSVPVSGKEEVTGGEVRSCRHFQKCCK